MLGQCLTMCTKRHALLRQTSGWRLKELYLRLRETGRKENPDVRWIDGRQSMANVLTKMNTDKAALSQFLRDGLFSLTQTEENRKQKLKQQLQRQVQKAKKTYNECENHQFVGTHSPSAPPLEPG